MEILGYAGVLLVVVALWWFMRATAHLVPKAPNMREDEAKSRSAQATVLSWYEFTGGDLQTMKLRGDSRSVFLRVHVPDGEDYTASNTWRIDYGKGALLEEGMQLPVKIHHERPDVVFPAVDWIEYKEVEYVKKLYTKPGDDLKL